MIGCWLVRQGQEPDDALSTIAALRRETAYGDRRSTRVGRAVGHGPRLASLNRHERGTDAFDVLCFAWAVRDGRTIHNPDGQADDPADYAIARLLLAEAGEGWPEDRGEASELIERLRDRDDERAASRASCWNSIAGWHSASTAGSSRAASTSPAAIRGRSTAAAWEARAAAELEPGPFDYVAGGAGSEATMRANLEAFERRRLRPRMLTGNAQRDLSVEVLGLRSPAPFFLAPIGVLEIVHPEGEARRAPARQPRPACR